MPKKEYTLILIYIFIVFSFSCFMFIKRYTQLERGGNFHKHQNQIPFKEIDTIQKWMTFDYINHRFNLPKDYLKNELIITNTKYPKVTIEKVAISQNQDINIFIINIKESIRKYTTSSH